MSRTPIFQRSIQKAVFENLKYFPFISITGPRQSGKTTLCHLAGSQFEYINFENEEHAEFALKDTKQFIKKYSNKVILDEVQKVPKLFSALMVHTDAQNKNGAYILSGSQNFLLMAKISQSLAGRVAVFSLLPLSLTEIFPHLKAKEKNWMQIAIRGFYPRLYKEKNLKTNVFYNSYIKTYVERDVRQLVNLQEAGVFKQFLKLCAVRAGNIINFNEIGAQLGVSNTTIGRWISILETSYIIYLLPCYYRNFDKRILKKPKLYFYDTGVLNHLLNISTELQLDEHKCKGAIFENFIITDILKSYYNKGIQPDAFFWQDSNGNEVDLIIEDKTLLKIYEIKSSTTPKLEFAKTLNQFELMAAKEGLKTKKYLVYAGDETYSIQKLHITAWQTLATT